VPDGRSPEVNLGSRFPINFVSTCLYVKKSPVDVVLAQADKLKAEIAELEEELKAKKRQLDKFEQARKLFEAS